MPIKCFVLAMCSTFVTQFLLSVSDVHVTCIHAYSSLSEFRLLENLNSVLKYTCRLITACLVYLSNSEKPSTPHNTRSCSHNDHD